MARRGARRVPAIKRLMTGITAGLVLATVLLPVGGIGVASENAGLDVVGKLSVPERTEGEWLVGVDEDRRLLYYIYRGVTDVLLREYDLDARLPRLRRERAIASYEDIALNYASPYTMPFDAKSRRMMIMGENTIHFVDLKTLKTIGSWDFNTIVPGFNLQGLTYSRADKRIYAVGSMSGNQLVSLNSLLAKPAQVSVVLALDASGSPEDRPEILWARPVPQCQQPLDTFVIRTLIARSLNQDALYFACIRADPWPGESGVVRIWIDPKAGQEEAANFDVDFFPVSGSYISRTEGSVGVAAFDYKTDRFFMQSLAPSTPGAWVLDGRMSAWVGFIAAPDNKNRYLGIDQSSGHFYMASRDYIVVANGRSTPVEQGLVFPGMGAASFIVTDPVSHTMLFASEDLDRYGLVPKKAESKRGFVVADDNTPIVRPAKPPSYDSLTSNIEETNDTITTFSGGINGFGARVVAVGGYGGLISASGQQVGVSQVRAGDRGFTAARVPQVDLRSGASAAKAEAFISDSNTEAEVHDVAQQEWPWPQASCFDGGGDPGAAEAPGPGGNAQVSCKLDSEKASASAEFGRLAGEGVAIGSSSVVATTSRMPDKGVRTDVTAVARGIELNSPSGSVSIAEVRASSGTIAFGRPKTAKATWDRVLSGIEIRDADGKTTQRIGECVSTPKEDDCERVAKQINEALEIRIRVDLPTPDVVGTPKGAFAGVGQGQADFLHGRTVLNQGTTFGGEASSAASPAMQIVVFNDSVEKSRLVFQLAAVQANSIYTVSEAPEPPKISDPVSDVVDDAGDAVSSGGGGSLGSSSISVPGDSSIDAAPVAAPIAAASTPAVVRAVRAFLTRPLTEALLVGAVWILFLSAGAGIYRRRALMSVVHGGGS